MANEPVHYDAKAAEEAFTRLRSSFQMGMPRPQDDSMAAIVAVQGYALVAQAHALERIAQALEAIHRDYLGDPDSLKRVSATHTAKKS